jgi:hypothetical protein
MPHLLISTAPSRELYESVRGVLDPAELRGDGLLLHAASTLDSGEVRIVDLYDSAEAFERADRRVRAAFATAGVEAVVEARPMPEVSETFELVR